MKSFRDRVANLSSAWHTLRREPWLVVTVIASVLGACGCAEPCRYWDTQHPAPETTPFSDGRTVFSLCDACSVQREGSVTACHVSFNHDSPEAEVSCMYGPNGDHSYSQDESRVPGIPNMFDFCEDRCNNSSLRFCTLTATSKGVRELACVYGKNCD